MHIKANRPAPEPEIEEPIEVYEEVQEGDVEEAPPSLPSPPKRRTSGLLL